MKKMILMLAAATLTLAACNNDKTTDTDDKMDDKDKLGMSQEDKEERNKKTALASVEGVNAHDLNIVFKDVAPDAVDYFDGSMPPQKNLDSIKAGFSNFLSAYPDVKGENLKAVADGEWVMVWGEWSGTWKGDFMGQKATGKPYKIKDVDIFRFNDEGKITEHHSVQSWATQANQVGMKMQ